MAVRLFRRLKPLAGLFSSLARRSQIGDHFFFFHAPIVIVIAAKAPIDGALAAQNMEFVAEANGLGVLFSGFLPQPRARRAGSKKPLASPGAKRLSPHWCWATRR